MMRAGYRSPEAMMARAGIQDLVPGGVTGLGFFNRSLPIGMPFWPSFWRWS